MQNILPKIEFPKINADAISADVIVIAQFFSSEFVGPGYFLPGINDSVTEKVGIRWHPPVRLHKEVWEIGKKIYF